MTEAISLVLMVAGLAALVKGFDCYRSRDFAGRKNREFQAYVWWFGAFVLGQIFIWIALGLLS